MLIYHPMVDPYHCALRLAWLAIDGPKDEIEWDRLRLLDFFVVFPHLLQNVRFSTDSRKAKAALKSVPTPYETLPSPPRLFFQLNQIQEPAARLLTARGFFDREAFLQATIRISRANAVVELERMGGHLECRLSDWYQFIVQNLTAYPLDGKDGLKARSGLMEYRHDPV